MSVLESLNGEPFNAEVHWVVRSDLKSVPALSSKVHKAWDFDRKDGLLGLIKLGFELRKEGFSHIYDAHSSMRSRILCSILRPFCLGPRLARRSKERIKRILLFSFGINKFPKPFKGMISYHRPIEKWGIKSKETFKDIWNFENHNNFEGIALAPSAAWEMKRWPIDHWKNLIRLLPDQKFVVLGGPGDQFCQELEEVDSSRVKNLAGKLSLAESCELVSKAPLLVSADTGLIHVADLLGNKGISLMGPTAFGFATNKNIKTLELELPCRPCTKDGRGTCSQDVYQRCMVELSPEMVVNEIQNIFKS